MAEELIWKVIDIFRDPRMIYTLFSVFFAFLAIGLLLMRFWKHQKRDRLIEMLAGKTERSSSKARTIILAAETEAMKEVERDRKYRLEAFNPKAIKRDLKRSGIRVGWPFVYLFGAVLAYAFAYFVVAAPIYSLNTVSWSVFLPCFLLVRFGVIGMMIDTQKMKMMNQLIMFIESVQRAVSIGTSPEEAVTDAINDTENPLKEHLLVIRELIDLGYDFVHALGLTADRVNLPEFDVFVSALDAQSIAGGSVGEVLVEVVEITKARAQLRKKISTITAEGRFNAFLLGSLPIILTIYLRYSQPDYAMLVWDDQIWWGKYLYFAQLGMAILGAWLATVIAKIKV